MQNYNPNRAGVRRGVLADAEPGVTMDCRFRSLSRASSFSSSISFMRTEAFCISA